MIIWIGYDWIEHDRTRQNACVLCEWDKVLPISQVAAPLRQQTNPGSKSKHPDVGGCQTYGPFCRPCIMLAPPFKKVSIHLPLVSQQGGLPVLRHCYPGRHFNRQSDWPTSEQHVGNKNVFELKTWGPALGSRPLYGASTADWERRKGSFCDWSYRIPW